MCAVGGFESNKTLYSHNISSNFTVIFFLMMVWGLTLTSQIVYNDYATFLIKYSRLLNRYYKGIYTLFTHNKYGSSILNR